MRRFSQRNSLVTLSDINITPLLDLAFVLLIIFIITTPLLEASLPLKLPNGGGPSPTLSKSDYRTVEIDTSGHYAYERQRMGLDQIETELVRDFQYNPNLVVKIRADKNGFNRDLYALLNRCLRHNITRINLQTFPDSGR